MWLVAVVAVPLLSLGAAPLGTLVGLRGPCSDYVPRMSAILAVNLGIPAGIVLTLIVLVARAVGANGGTWVRVMLAVYAVVAVAVAVDFSGMCK